MTLDDRNRLMDKVAAFDQYSSEISTCTDLLKKARASESGLVEIKIYDQSISVPIEKLIIFIEEQVFALDEMRREL